MQLSVDDSVSSTASSKSLAAGNMVVGSRLAIVMNSMYRHSVENRRRKVSKWRNIFFVKIMTCCREIFSPGGAKKSQDVRKASLPGTSQTVFTQVW